MSNPLTWLSNRVTNAYKRGFYEGGKVTNANKDFWNATSSFETTAMPDRDRLRARARWLSANNAIMDNIDNAIINNVVGNGITLQSITGMKAFDKDVETRFNQWAKDHEVCDSTGRFTFATLQRMIIKSRMVDGEIFIYFNITKKGLSLQLIESDSLDAGRQDGGIELDHKNKVKKYHFTDANNKPFSIKAKNIINFFMPERPTQYRGLTEYKQAILDIKNFSAFQSASIQGARARANIAYAVKQNGGVAGYGADAPTKIQSINGVNVLYMNKGEDITKLDPDSVATDYVQFSESTIRLIATARKVSYELAFRDYSKVNFASSRASILQDFKRFDYEQEFLRDYFLQKVYKAWLETEIYAGRVKAPNFDNNRTKYLKVKWIMPKRDLVDPLKEITAIEKKIKLNLTSETDMANASGEDYEQILQTKANEIALKEKYGLPLDNTVGDTNMIGKTGLDTNITGGEKKA